MTVITLSLEAFEAYAVGLNGILGGSAEAVTEALALLLKSSLPVAPSGAPQKSEETPDVVTWCLEGDALAGAGPEAIARALLLQRAVASSASGEGRERLLATAPTALAKAPSPVALRLAETVAQDLPDDGQAAAWLRTLRAPPADADASAPEAVSAACAVRAYSRAAAALLARHPAGEVRAEAWAAATAIVTGKDGDERRACAQHLLPALVEATDAEEASERLSAFVGELLGRGGRADVADALGLAVSFHGPLLDFWRLASLAGDHEELGVKLIETGLRFGLKENASLRRQARFLLEAAARRALSAAGADERLRAHGVRASDVQAAWHVFWEFADTLEDYASHILKSSWDTLSGKLMAYLGRLAHAAEGAGKRRLPPALMAPSWFEVLLCRALGHDNDTVHKFVLGQLVMLDQRVACLSEAFVLGEMFQRFSHSIDILYPRADVHQTFERQTAAFFTAFVARHCEGPGTGARRLLLALLENRAVHYTPLRLLLTVLAEVEAPGALGVEEALDLSTTFFEERVTRLPISVRPIVAPLFLRTMENLTSGAGQGAPLAAATARAAAAIPDAHLDDVMGPLAALARRALGKDDWAGRLQDLLRGLLSSASAEAAAGSPCEAAGRAAAPMQAARLALGAVRLLAALGAGDAAASTDVLWRELAPALRDVHRRTYLPRRASAAALLAAAYGAALLPGGAAALEARGEERREALAFVEGRARAALSPEAKEAEAEAPWVWLYALTLERLWQPGLPHGDVVLAAAASNLQAAAGGPRAADASLALTTCASAALLGAMAPKVEDAGDRAKLFGLLWHARIEKPASVHDPRFSVVAGTEAGGWPRNRLEEYDDLQRADREGLGRVFEWRDVMSVFLMAKWRALSLLARSAGLLEALRQDLGGESVEALAQGLLDEQETLQPPHVAFWAVVARKIAFPVIFAAGRPEEEQRESLRLLCQSLRGAAAEGSGDSAVHMPRGCAAELAATLCDPCLWEAERRLYSTDELGPVTSGVRALLSVGEVAVGLARYVAAPALATLLGERKGGEENPGGAADVMTSLLLHREATIQDGALSHAPDAAAGLLDQQGVGGASALDEVCPSSEAIRQKFRGTAGLPRILALAGMNAVACRSREQDSMAPVVTATLQRVLAILRETLDSLLNPPGAKKMPKGVSRPPTPMPLSDKHRTQLRGWQAVFVLGHRADRATAATLLPELFHHLAVPHVPDVRDCQELLGCALCSAFEDLAVEPLIVPALKNYDVASQVSASLLVISGFLFQTWARTVAAAAPTATGQELWGSHDPRRIASLVQAAAPYLSHNSAYVRGTAAWGIHEIFSALGEQRLCELAPEGAEGSSLLRELYLFVATNKECKKMRGRLKPIFESFEPTASCNWYSMLERSMVLPPSLGDAGATSCGGEEEASQPLYNFVDAEFQPTGTFLNFLKDEVAQEMEFLFDRSDMTEYPSCSENWTMLMHEAIAAEQASKPGSPATAAAARPPAAARVLPSREAREAAAAEGVVGTQRKFEPLAAPVRADEESSALATPSVGRQRLPLVVIASLIDKTPNLAGLCRTAEVFNCEAVCLANAKITKDQAFQSISVTAEKWLPIREVPKTSLSAHLRELRRRGYCIVGIEQTHNSVQMGEFVFPENAAIVLGAEKEGIDADLLPLLDACVEIPQAGQLRSLNVHVSGSLAIWEYTRQLLASRALANASM